MTAGGHSLQPMTLNSMNEMPNNLCTHFLDACRDRKSAHARQLDILRVIDSAALVQISRWIAFGQKFFLPSGGYILQEDQPKPMVAEDDATILTLPFPVTVLEYRMGAQCRLLSDLSKPLWEAVGDKRITLLVNIPAKGEIDVASVRTSCFAEPIDPQLWELLDRKGGIMVFALWFDENEQLWSIGIGACVLPRSQLIDALSPERAEEWKSEMVMQLDVQVLHAFVPCLMGTYARLAYQHGHAPVQESMRNDVLSDVGVATDFLRAFHCANVQTNPVVIDGMEKLNKKRQKSGKLSFFVYRVLVDKPLDKTIGEKAARLQPGQVQTNAQGQRIFRQASA